MEGEQTSGRRSTTRRALLLALAGSGACLLLSACGGAATGTVTATSAVPTLAPAARGAATPATAAKPTTAAGGASSAVPIQEWFDLPGAMATHVNLVAQQFNTAHAGIEVKPSVVPTAEMGTKLATAIAGGEPPDLAYIGPPSVFSNLLLANQLEPLDTYDPKIGDLDWLAPIKQLATHNG